VSFVPFFLGGRMLHAEKLITKFWRLQHVPQKSRIFGEPFGVLFRGQISPVLGLWVPVFFHTKFTPSLLWPSSLFLPEH
jgi:hypothetical protein